MVSDGDDECYETVDPSLTARSIVQQKEAEQLTAQVGASLRCPQYD